MLAEPAERLARRRGTRAHFQFAVSAHLELPLEQLYRLRDADDQLAFAGEALAHVPRRHDIGAHASALGLHVLARDEEALQASGATLRAAYGDVLEAEPPRARLVCGVRTEEPIMRVGITAGDRHRRAVLQVMARRGARRVRNRQRPSLLLYEAPLAELLGFGAELDRVTDCTVLHWMSLCRYTWVDRSGKRPRWQPGGAYRTADGPLAAPSPASRAWMMAW
jgi:hypothetical protein